MCKINEGASSVSHVRAHDTSSGQWVPCQGLELETSPVFGKAPGEGIGPPEISAISAPCGLWSECEDYAGFSEVQRGITNF